MNRGGLVAQLKRVARAYRRLADRVAECVRQGVERPPPGTMARDDVLDPEWPQSIHGGRDDALHDAAEMQPAHHTVEGSVRKESTRMGADIDDAGVRTCAEH